MLDVWCCANLRILVGIHEIKSQHGRIDRLSSLCIGTKKCFPSEICVFKGSSIFLEGLWNAKMLCRPVWVCEVIRSCSDDVRNAILMLVSLCPWWHVLLGHFMLQHLRTIAPYKVLRHGTFPTKMLPRTLTWWLDFWCLGSCKARCASWPDLDYGRKQWNSFYENGHGTALLLYNCAQSDLHTWGFRNFDTCLRIFYTISLLCELLFRNLQWDQAFNTLRHKRVSCVFYFW